MNKWCIRPTSWFAVFVALTVGANAHADCLELDAPVGEWHHEGSDIPPNTIRLLNDGRIDFGTYLVQYKNGTWSFDKSTCELVIASDSFDANTLWVNASHVQGGLRMAGDPIRVDKAKKSIVYLISTPDSCFDFNGFVYYKRPDLPQVSPPNQPLHYDASGAAVVAGERRR